MSKVSVLKDIAEDGYNIGFGSCKSFATFDIANSWIRIISLLSLIIGVIQLKVDDATVNNKISVILIIVGIVAMHLSNFIREKELYEKAGVKQRMLYNQMKSLYREAQDIRDEDIPNIMERKEQIMDEFYSISLSDEVFIFSDIYAHYKFFYKIQHEWVDEQKNFKFFRDKVPNSLKAFVPVLIVIGIVSYYYLQP